MAPLDEELDELLDELLEEELLVEEELLLEELLEELLLDEAVSPLLLGLLPPQAVSASAPAPSSNSCTVLNECFIGIPCIGFMGFN